MKTIIIVIMLVFMLVFGFIKTSEAVGARFSTESNPDYPNVSGEALTCSKCVKYAHFLVKDKLYCINHKPYIDVEDIKKEFIQLQKQLSELKAEVEELRKMVKQMRVSASSTLTDDNSGWEIAYNPDNPFMPFTAVKKSKFIFEKDCQK